jgi:hypothetical protein
MDPDSRQIGMTANIALPAVTRNFMLDVVELSDKIRSRYLWSFEGSILAFAGWIVPHVCLAYARALAAEAGLNVYFPVLMTPQESILSLPVFH